MQAPIDAFKSDIAAVGYVATVPIRKLAARGDSSN